MKSKLYKHYRKPSYFHLRKMGYISFSVTILMMGILIPLSLISVGAYQQSSSTSIVDESSLVSEDSQTTSETTEEEEVLITITTGHDYTEKVWLCK
jgi:cytochrome c-type biogenesis protein CcmH/NrfG